ncbi:cation diffusion facilitator family transporter [Actinophytocola oryzae]|uniref:Cobalt-zinc-cadmium efflux system protein n=1 Tax=Actinophytocola oryzae TaxID=502181 RepID=A0A4R7VWV3_9PSEU|nr:cation diffusion facilitator family transporter [Actinophytocola oryzae]TDV53969.1 cobalt-zinc-cadmium efflux system protein [Actinophytocola oryzae]
MGHGHGHVTSASGRHAGRLVATFVITASFMVVEIATGVATGSLALLSDGAHMVTDVLGVGLALAAILAARRAHRQPGRTFGLYRAEVLAALANAVLLFGVAAYVLYEAVTRFSSPPDVPGTPVVVVSLLGLAANVVAFVLLREGAAESLNLRGAYLEVVADMVGSVGVLVSGLVTLVFGWRYADPVIGVAIGVFVLPRTWTLAKRSLRILFQHAPERVDVAALTGALGRLPGVGEVHDVHVWTLTSGMEVASAHLTVDPGCDQSAILAAARALLAEEYQLEHATLQVETGVAAVSCRQLHW